MAKLDRLGWAAGISLSAFGVRIGLRATSEEALTPLLARLLPGWMPSTSPRVNQLYSLVAGGPGPRPGLRRFHVLYSGSMQLARSHVLTDVVEAFEADAQLHVAELARNRLFVHAGVVGWKGKAILLPGRSHSGKSTLVAALLRAGATYYSDEYAILDAQGRVHPYPKPLSLRHANGEQAQPLPLEAWRWPPARNALPVGLVVVTTYKPGRRWRPRTLSPGQAILALLSHTVPARRRPEAALTQLQRVVAGARVLKSVRGSADETAVPLLQCLDAS